MTHGHIRTAGKWCHLPGVLAAAERLLRESHGRRALPLRDRHGFAR
jgi:hypothetical protein